MASVRVAVRVRPMNKREIDLESEFIIKMEGKKTIISNPKIPELNDRGEGDHSRERAKAFSYDYSYWSVDKKDKHYVSQEQVMKDLGNDVISSAFEGYNACIFAYGQTGSGKSYTMMGNHDDVGLTPRICEGLFERMNKNKDEEGITYRTEVSYLEIYNEKVRDLLRNQKAGQPTHMLRVREHPKDGPYVQDLSSHVVMNYEDIEEMMAKGNAVRTTASTLMNDTSSRSHAIFTVRFLQAKFDKNMPSETQSKIHLVDLAGSERADATGATGQRLKEGASINKSLVTLGNVISTLADMSEKGPKSRNVFVPYRDSVLTWLLKDSLGGNAKTVMIATISPSSVNYGETLSTLRYANRAKNIINKPTVNEDPNVRLIRELRAEIERLKALLGGNITTGEGDNITGPKVQERLHESEARVKVLTEEWTGKWKEAQNILQQDNNLALKKEGMGIVLDSQLPHLIGIDDDLLSTGIMLYHLKEGRTSIGRADAEVQPDIALSGLEVEKEHCYIDNVDGIVTLSPIADAICTVNGVSIEEPTKLYQGAVILLGKTNMFRFNHPKEAARLRQERKLLSPDLKGGLGKQWSSRVSLLSASMTDLSRARSTDNLSMFSGLGNDLEQRHKNELVNLEAKRQEIEDLEEKFRQHEDARQAEQESKENELEKAKSELEGMKHRLKQWKEDELKGEWQKLEEEREYLHRKMEEERKKLEEMERNYHKSVMEAEQELIEALETFEKEKQLQQETLEEEWKRIEEKNREQQEKVRYLEEEIARKRELVQREKAEVKCQEMELNLMEEERHRLLSQEEGGSFNSETVETWSDEYAAIQHALSDLDTREETLENDYEEAKAELQYEHYKLESELKLERDDLRKSQRALDEMEAKYKAASEAANVDSEEERQEVEQQFITLQTMKKNHREKENCLEEKEKEYNQKKISEMQQLQEYKDQETKKITEDRTGLRDRGNNILQLVEQELTSKSKLLQEHKLKVLQEEHILSELEKKHEGLVKVSFEQKGCIDQEKQKLLNAQKEEERHAEAQVDEKRESVESRKSQGHEVLEGQRSRMLDLEVQEEELSKRKEKFEKYSRNIEGSLFEKQYQVFELEAEVFKARERENQAHKEQVEMLQEDSNTWEQKVKELREKEIRLKKEEADLEEKRKKFEEERQHELDRIDDEKFKLQEMEEQERLNSLVEQEVKRRLFEEKVKREKQRMTEKEKEKQARDKEIQRIKKQHDKEIEKLKMQYENRCPNAGSSRANPYGSPMSPDDTFNSRRFARSLSNSSSNKLSKSMPSLALNTEDIEEPVVVVIPSFTLRGYGTDTHHEFEVKIRVLEEETWSVFRRYRRFREMHEHLKKKYPEVAALQFPPKKWFGNRTEKVVKERQNQLQEYVQHVLRVCRKNPDCPLHPNKSKYLSKQTLFEFSPFFKKGVFESSKHGTG